MSLHHLVVLSRISRGMERVNELLLVEKGEKGKNKRDGKLIVLFGGGGTVISRLYIFTAFFFGEYLLFTDV